MLFKLTKIVYRAKSTAMTDYEFHSQKKKICNYLNSIFSLLLNLNFYFIRFKHPLHYIVGKFRSSKEKFNCRTIYQTIVLETIKE